MSALELRPSRVSLGYQLGMMITSRRDHAFRALAGWRTQFPVIAVSMEAIGARSFQKEHCRDGP